jgi:hypothetical protein
MSQFILISGPIEIVEKSGICIRELTPGSRELPDSAAEGLDPEARMWFFEDEIAKSTEHVFVEAQKDIAEGKDFCETRLSGMLSALLKTADDIYLWYGDEWQDLPVVKEPRKFLEVIARDLMNGSGEIYLHYRKPHI